MKIVIDMNLSPSWVPLLKSAGFDAIHWSSIGDPKAKDFVILNWAAQNGFVVFTNDLDFGALLANSRAQLPSVFQLRTSNLSPTKIGSRVINLMKQFDSELSSGALITIDDIKNRIRILPLNP